jgi:hypothetical protein
MLNTTEQTELNIDTVAALVPDVVPVDARMAEPAAADEVAQEVPLKPDEQPGLENPGESTVDPAPDRAAEASGEPDASLEPGPQDLGNAETESSKPPPPNAENTETQLDVPESAPAVKFAKPVPQPKWDMPAHPVADLFPLIPEKKLEDLIADIAEHGLIHAIVVHEGKVVDGRNRLPACRAAGVVPRFIEWRDVYDGPMSLSQWIWSNNGQRRHLSAGQIAGILVKLRGFEEKEAARQRRIDAGKQQGERGKEGGRGHVKPVLTIPSERVSSAITSEQVGDGYPDSSDSAFATRPKSGSSGTVRARLAREGNVSEHMAQQAMNVEKANPALLTEVIQGKRELRDAAKEVTGDKTATKSISTREAAVRDTPTSTFDPEHKIKAVVRVADKEIENLAGERRDIVLRGIIDKLTKML